MEIAAVALPPVIKQLDEKMAGLPDQALTILLLIAAVVIVLVALFGRPVLKAAVAAWVIAP